MALTVITPTTNSDRTTIGSHGAVVPGTPDSLITFPAGSGVVSLGLSQIASGIITIAPGSGSAISSSASVSGLTSTDIVLASFDTDASASSQLFTKVDASADTITAYAYALTGSSYVKCHYVVLRP